MDTRHPHDIVDDIQQVSPDQRKHYFRLPNNIAQKLKQMSPEDRGKWLAEHPLDQQRLERAELKRERKRRKRNEAS